MHGSRLSIIIPSCGRSTLENTVQSVLNQLGPEDELIVVGNRKPAQFSDPNSRPFVFMHRDNKGCRGDNSTLSGPSNTTHGPRGTESGAIERDMGDANASGTHLLHIDDDDIFVKDAFEKVRASVFAFPDRVLIFRMAYGIADQWISPYSVNLDGVPTLGVQERVSMANFGGMMMVFPRVTPNPKWEQHGEMRNSCEDYFTTKRYLEALGTEPVWPRMTIGIVRPDENQLVEHDAWMVKPVYAPQPAWDGRQQPRRRIPVLDPFKEAMKARRRAGKRNAP